LPFAIIHEELVLLASSGFLYDKTGVVDVVQAVAPAPRIEDFLGGTVWTQMRRLGFRIFFFVDRTVAGALIVPFGVLYFYQAVRTVS
jgi:hypothetical protein